MLEGQSRAFKDADFRQVF